MSRQFFEIGEVVKLKSGGPSMTVESVAAEKVTVCWFEKERLRRELLHPQTLDQDLQHIMRQLILQDPDGTADQSRDRVI